MYLCHFENIFISNSLNFVSYSFESIPLISWIQKGEPGFIPYFELMEMEAWFEDPNYIANSNYTNNTLTTNYNTGTMEMVLMNQDGDLTFTSYDSTGEFKLRYFVVLFCKNNMRRYDVLIWVQLFFFHFPT